MKYLKIFLNVTSHRAALLLTWLLLATTSPADNFTTSVYQPYRLPPVTWNEPIWEPSPSASTFGNTYEVLEGGLIRNPPVAGMQTFPGDSLTLDTGAGMKAKGPAGTTLNFPGVDGSPGLILNGGTVIAADDQTFTIAGRVSVASDSSIDLLSGARSFTITAQIDGHGSLTLIKGGNTNPLDIQSEHNPYAGNWVIEEGYLKGTGDGSLGSGSITIYNGAILEIDYDIQSPGALTLLGGDSVMILHQDCQFGAVTINDIPLAPGIYDCAQLTAQFPGNFASCGSGSITVVSLTPASTDSVVSDQEVSPQSLADLEGITEEIVDPLATSVDAGVPDGSLRLIPVGIIDTTAPVAAMGVIVAAQSQSQIEIRWNASSDSGGSGLVHYKVYRNGSLVGLTTATTYEDDGLNPGGQYCYAIVAFDNAGNAALRSPQSCTSTPSVDTNDLSIPGNVVATANSKTEITVRWDASTDIRGAGAKGYRIFRNGVYIRLTTTTGFIDAGLAPDTQYCYTVDAFDYQYNRSPASAQTCARTLRSLGPAPAAPSKLTVIAVSTGQVTLNWEDNSGDELGFLIELAPSPSGPWSEAGTTEADVNSYTDTGLAPSTTFYYRVLAFN